MPKAARRILDQSLVLAGHGLLLAWLLLILVPLVIVVLSTVKSNQDLFSNPLGIDLANIKWQNFVDALNGPVGGRPMWNYIGNSVIAAGFSLALAMATGVLAAYGLARSQGRTGRTMTLLFTLLVTVPVLATLVPMFDLMGALHLRNSPAGLSIVYAAFMVPPTTLLLRPYFAAIPAELIEAAWIDGATEARSFRHIVFPLARPSIFGVLIVNAIWVWSELAFATVLLTSPESKTVPVGLLAFKGQYTQEIGVQFAGLVIAALPMVVIYLIFANRVTDGMASGGALK